MLLYFSLFSITVTKGIIMRTIILTGFMGAGKSRVGKELAKKLSILYIDTDKLIEQKSGRKIKDIFKEHGEAYFRELECEVIRGLPVNQSLIISIGGGAIVNGENLKKLQQLGIIIWLKVSPQEIYKRLKKARKKRPLLALESVPELEYIENITKILLTREPYYHKADYQIETDNKTIREILEELLNIFKEKKWI